MGVINFSRVPLIALISLNFVSRFSEADVVERVEAIINKKAVYKSDIDRFRIQVPLRAKIDPLFSNDPLAKKSSASNTEILNFLVSEIIISDKFPIGDAEVEQEVNSIQANLKIDRDQLKSAVSREGFKFEDYFKLMRASLSKRQLIDREIRNKAVVNDNDVNSESNRIHSTANTFHGAFHLYLSKYLKKDFKTPNLAKTEAQVALDECKKTNKFPGEDLGFLSYSEMSTELKRIVQKLGPEKTSGVVEDQDSFFIVKVGEIKNSSDISSDPEKEMLRSRLMEAEFEHQIKLWLDRERSNTYVKINNRPS